MFKFADISEAVQDFKNGKMLIAVDDEDRENEGDLVISAFKTTPEDINFMAKFGRGLICAPVSPKIADKFGLEPMVKSDSCTGDKIATNFTISIDYKHGTTTGISASDRAKTVNSLCDPKTACDDFIKPGHIFPLRSHSEGLKSRNGHTEAAIELTKMAGLPEVAVICEIINDDGTMARLPDLIQFAERHNLKIISIKEMCDIVA